MQYCIINNDIALLMHYRALLQMPVLDHGSQTSSDVYPQCITKLISRKKNFNYDSGNGNDKCKFNFNNLFLICFQNRFH